MKLFTVFCRMSSTGLSTDMGHGEKCQWDSKANFLGYLSLMGCKPYQVKEFELTGSISFLASSNDGSVPSRFFYTIHREKAHLEEDFQSLRAFQRNCTIQSLSQIGRNPTANY